MTRLQRLAFFGTPEIAVPSLNALVENGRAPILVVSQPDRPAGRGRRDRRPPVGERAADLGLPLAQPARVRDEAFLGSFRTLAPDLAVVVAFGQIFPAALLSVPRHGCVNVHFSLLPRFRGAAPVQAAIAAGESETGVTTMLMDQGLDTGPVLLRRSTSIGADEDAGRLAARLAALGADLLLETLAGLEADRLVPEPQPATGASYAPKLGPEAALADWTLSARRLHDRARSLSPRPGLEARLRGAPLKIWRTRLAPADATGAPGEVVAIDATAVRVRCGDGEDLDLLEVQRPGRRRIAAAEFARGERLRVGETFESPGHGA